MRANLAVGASGILACCALLVPVPLASQMPAPLGRLHITAGKDPTVKTTIKINGTPRNEQTPVTLAVVPGTYAIVIGTCPDQTISVTVASGETKEATCK